MNRAPRIVLCAVCALAGCRPRGGDAADELRFIREGAGPQTLARAALEARIPVETVTTFDPYYQKTKSFRALPLRAVLAAGFPGLDPAKEEFVLRARDGYAVNVDGARLVEPGGYVAVGDVEVPGWEPIGPQRVNPGPFYVIWRESKQSSLEEYPRPWQLASVEIARFEALYPHVSPDGESADSPAGAGFRIFRARCIRCHAINREGGRVGPDLNVPRSIVEYRPVAQIREYIANPRAFRYGLMPPHPDLTPVDLDGLIAYFQAMSQRKHDPDAGAK